MEDVEARFKTTKRLFMQQIWVFRGYKLIIFI